MKIALVSSAMPFVDGGYKFIIEWLDSVLREQGHQVEKIYHPSLEDPETLFDEMLAFRLLDLSDATDRVVTFRPPAHVVPHPNKVVWFIHHFRVWYDLWGTKYCTIPETPYWRAFRARLIRADRNALLEAQKVFTNSRTVSRRLREFNDIDSEPLYPPVHAPERFRSDEYGNEILCVCRFSNHKRQRLLVEAMHHTRTPVRLRLCGAYTPYVTELEAAAQGLDPLKVAIEARWISEEEKIERLAPALAVAYFPTDEDSYGYPTLEGAHARKGAIVASDGGGVTEFVRDGIEGFVLDPDPRAIADAFDRLWGDRRLAARLGEAAQVRVTELGIDWPSVVGKLLS